MKYYLNIIDEVFLKPPGQEGSMILSFLKRVVSLIKGVDSRVTRPSLKQTASQSTAVKSEHLSESNPSSPYTLLCFFNCPLTLYSFHYIYTLLHCDRCL